jgi:hypothetical protein
VWAVLLVTALTIAVRVFFTKGAAGSGASGSGGSGTSASPQVAADALKTTNEIIAKTGFNETGPTTTKTVTDEKTGAITTTTTDDKGKTMAVTTSKDGSSTTTTVKDEKGKVLDETKTTALDTAKALAPTLLMNIAAGEARDLILIGGAKIISKASKEISEKGVKSALQQGGKLVQRNGPDLAMKFLGYVTKEAADRSAQAAAETGFRKAAKEAADKVLAEELKKAGKKALTEVTEKGAKEAIEAAMQKAGKEAAEKVATEAVEKVAKKAVTTAAERAAAKMGTAAAAKIGAKAGMAAAKMGAKAGMGPVGWALMAFDVLSMALDIACCGGYCEVADTKTWEKQRDTLIGQVKAMVDDANAEGDDPVRWPIITGPFDKLDSATLQTRLMDNIKAALKDPENVYVKATVAKLKAAIDAKTITSEDQIDAFMEENLDLEGMLMASTKQLCTDLKGKIIMDADKFAGCSWADQAQCEASFKWPIVKENENDNYSVWNKEKGECNKDPVSQNMRGICEATNAFPFNKETKICDLNETYCKTKSMNWDGKNCKLSKGQEVAEMMFGTTVVRGLNQLYAADQYEPCPPGARPAGEIAALAAGVTAFSGPGALMLGTYLGQTLCATDQCPDGQVKISGLCYDQCKKAENANVNDYDEKADGITGATVQGMCYRCPKGFKKTTAGMCQREKCPDGQEQGSGLGVGFCYKKCTEVAGPEYTESDGASICKKPCPAGMVTEPLTCRRPPETKTSASAQKTCPPGWNQSVAGPGGMCRQNCTDGWKDVGGICYHPNVDTALLVKGPSKTACNAGDRDDGTSCWSPLKTDWCPGHKKQGCCHGPFWYVCNPAVTTGGTIVKTLMQRQYCPAGYDLRAGMCYAVSRPIQQSKPLLEVGQCNDSTKPEGSGGMCYQKCSDFGGSFKRSAVGLCQMDLMVTERTKTRDPAGPFVVAQPADQYSRPPLGISYKVFQKKRKVPFGKGPNGC